MGSGSYAQAGSVFRGNNADQTAASELDRLTAGVRVSAHVPAVVSTKQNNVIRLGSRRDMVAPVWEGLTLIPDEVTKAARGENSHQCYFAACGEDPQKIGLLQTASSSGLSDGGCSAIGSCWQQQIGACEGSFYGKATSLPWRLTSSKLLPPYFCKNVDLTDAIRYVPTSCYRLPST